MCRDFVKDNLRSPSTADFGGFFDDWDIAVFFSTEALANLDIEPSDFGLTDFRINGAWFVEGEVDAENAFGATIRSDYICLLDYEDSTGTWYLLDISITSR